MSRRALLRILERERIAHAAERAQLVSTICALSGQSHAAPLPHEQPAQTEAPLPPGYESAEAV